MGSAGGDEEYICSLTHYARSVGFPSTRLRVFKDPTDEVKLTLLRAADIFTSPADSIQEAFGLAPVEAMACGVPQVVADWDGYRETVDHGKTGFLVPTLWARCDQELSDTGFLFDWTHDHEILGQSVAMDVEYWRDAILTLVQNAELRRTMSLASRKRAEALYSMKSVQRQYYDLWGDLVAHPVLANNKRLGHLARPRYYDWFGHFASTQVSTITTIEVVRHPDKLARLEKAGAFGRCVSKDIVYSILNIAAEAGGSIAVAEVLDSLASKWDSTVVLRHVMWALKYGALKTAAGHQANTTNKGADSEP